MPETPITYIIGHKNPDADSICSAIAYAAFKEATGQKGFVPARCGNSNARIDTILKYFKQPLPRFVGDMTPRVEDIMRRKVLKIDVDSTCAEALELIDVYDVRALPVTDADNHLYGQVSIFGLGEFFIPKPKEPRKMRHLHSSVAQIIRALNARVLNVVDGERVEDLYVRIGAMDIRSFGRFTREEGTRSEESIVVVGDRYDIQQCAIQLGVRLVVITGNLEVDEHVVQMAKERNVCLIVSASDSATTSWMIRAATKIGPMVDKKMPTFGPEETLTAVKRKVGNSSAPIFCVVDDNNRLLGLFSKTDLLRPVQKSLVLVDHNELGQAVKGASDVVIAEIIDHHRLGNAPTAQPIVFRNEIIGSTCSIIALMYREQGLEPSPSIAGIMMAGLISDTLNLQSPTTTERDVQLLAWLSSLAGVEPNELSQMIFESGSMILHAPADAIITADCKHYTEGQLSYSVSQIEELGFDNFWKRSDEVLAALKQYQTANGLDFSALLVTDINRQNSMLLVQGDERVLEAISFTHVDQRNIFELLGIVSRKKQLIPYFTNLLESIGVA